MVETLLTASAFIILASILLTLVRLVKGPALADRAVSFDVMTIASIGLIAWIAHFSGRYIYLDVALIYGFISFLGILVIARYIEKGL